jgi:hypothetical protein
MWRYRGIRDSKPPLQIGEFLIVGTSRRRLVWCPLHSRQQAQRVPSSLVIVHQDQDDIYRNSLPAGQLAAPRGIRIRRDPLVSSSPVGDGA